MRDTSAIPVPPSKNSATWTSSRSPPPVPAGSRVTLPTPPIAFELEEPAHGPRQAIATPGPEGVEICERLPDEMPISIVVQISPSRLVKENAGRSSPDVLMPQKIAVGCRCGPGSAQQR